MQLRGWADSLRTPATALSLIIVLLAVAAGFAGPHLGLVAPDAMEATPYLPPGASHWFGTDQFGRDVASRVVAGARVALIVAVGSSALSSLIGVVLGALAGYYGGWIDAVLSRGFDVFLLIPTFFLVLLIVALFGASLGLTLFAIAVTTWPRSARIMRAQVLTLRSRAYVQAALAAGGSARRALIDHIVPNGLPPIITDATLLMGLAILTEAGLSFLGLGDQNTVSWGQMIFEGQRQLRLAPWMSIFPGLAMLLLVAAFNLLGDALNLALDPKQVRRARRGMVRQPTVALAAGAPDGATLAVSGLALDYRIGSRRVRAVDGVSFRLARGDSLGIVGESGCGKSSLGLALLQLLPENAVLAGGDVSFDGRKLLDGGRVVTAGGRPAVAALRWVHLSMIFQGAMSALNPVMTVRRQLVEAYRLHRPSAARAEAVARIGALFDLVGVPRGRLDAYPHELSGGMRQRVVIALSLLLEPDLVIADEPTTALDALVQDQILGEISALRARMNLSLILVSHDIGAVAETCARIAVMYAGAIIESGPTAAVFAAPAHPYTQALVAAMPRLTGPVQPPAGLPGDAAMAAPAQGCRFSQRCPRAAARCREEPPAAVPVGADHVAACHFARAA